MLTIGIVPTTTSSMASVADLKRDVQVDRRRDRDGHGRRTCGLKPASSARSSYVPGGIAATTNRPAAPVTTVRARPVAVFRTVTETPGSTPPFASASVPVMVAGGLRRDGRDERRAERHDEQETDPETHA